MIDINNKEISFLIGVVREASLLAINIQSSLVNETMTKGDKSPVTVADFAVQALIAKKLIEEFPDDPLVGEENSNLLQKTEEKGNLASITKFISNHFPDTTPEEAISWIDHGNGEPTNRFWTLDPIDGTKGFLRGEQYAIALALIIDSEVKLGVLGCPNLTKGHIQDIGGSGSIIIAEKGNGAWLTSLTESDNLTKIQVSSISDPPKARFLRSAEAGHTNVSKLDLIGKTMGVKSAPVRLDSQAKYAILASGYGELIFRLISDKMPNYKEKIWDQAAGSIIVEEAGGKVTDLDGKALDFNQGRTLAKNRGVLASNIHLHDNALDAIKAVQA